MKNFWRWAAALGAAVLVAACGGGGGNGSSAGIATPVLTQLSPSTAIAGGSGFTLTLSGSNFASTSSVLWNGQVRATTYVSPTTVRAQIAAADVAAPGQAFVTVSNASSGGGVSSALGFSVTGPVPAISSLSPTTAAYGGSGYLLRVNGSGFDVSAQVYWDGNPRATTFVSETLITANISTTDLGRTGLIPVTVRNLAGGAPDSNAVNVTVAPAPLALTALAPASVAAGGTAYAQTVLGTGFDTSSVVQWNGAPRATTFVSTTALKVQVSAADIASVGSARLQVVNTGSHAGTSVEQVLTIGAPSIDATAFRINPQHSGAIRFGTIVPPSAFPLTPAWTTVLHGRASYPLIVGGRVFVTADLGPGAGSEIVALSAASGAVLWGPVAIPGPANATYDNGRVIVLSSGFMQGVVTALDAATGAPSWSTTLTSQRDFGSPPTALNGMVFAGGSGSVGVVFAIDDATGLQMWQAPGNASSSPTLTVDGLYVSLICQTYAVDPVSGGLNWRDSTGCEGGSGATGAYANGVYYSPNLSSVNYDGTSYDAETGHALGTYAASQPPALGATTGYFLKDGTLSAIGLPTGATAWTFTGDGTLSTAPILVNDYVFIGSNSGQLYGLDAATGAVLWTAALGNPANGCWNQLGESGLAAGNGLLVVPAGNTLTAYTLSDKP